MLRRLILLGLLGLPSPAWAACRTLDTTTWTQDQRNRLPAIAYRLVFEAGENIVPTGTGATLCFAGSTVDLPTVLTPTTVLDRYAADETARQTAVTAEQTAQASFTTEIAANNLCEASLADIISRIDAEQATIQTQIDATSNIAGARTAMTTMNQRISAALKKVAKCVRARAR